MVCNMSVVVFLFYSEALDPSLCLVLIVLLSLCSNLLRRSSREQLGLLANFYHEMCPSNNCKIIFDKYVDEFIGSGVVLTTEPNKNKMTLNGYFRLTGGEDDKCICIIGLLFECETHTETNEKLGTTKYVCGGSGSFIPEDESKGAYNYDYTASFELPSKHFIFNGTSTGTTGGSQHDCILFDC